MKIKTLMLTVEMHSKAAKITETVKVPQNTQITRKYKTG